MPKYPDDDDVDYGYLTILCTNCRKIIVKQSTITKVLKSKSLPSQRTHMMNAILAQFDSTDYCFTFLQNISICLSTILQ